MSGATSNFVTKSFGRNNGILVTDTLVGLEIEGKERVIFFNKRFAGSLDCLGSDTALKMSNEGEKKKIGKGLGRMDRERLQGNLPC